MSRGFYQVPLAPATAEKTAFCSPWGKLQFKRMPFGLKNAPACFQRIMDVALVDLIDFTCVYIDDILVFSKSWEEHIMHIVLVLTALEKAGLSANPDKCYGGRIP